MTPQEFKEIESMGQLFVDVMAKWHKKHGTKKRLPKRIAEREIRRIMAQWGSRN